jgi:hypothetical protein
MLRAAGILAAAALGGLATGPALAQSFPSIGADSGPQLIVTLTDEPPGSCSLTGDDCLATLSWTGQPSYDLAGDIYVGVVNDSPVQIDFIDLGGPGVFDFKPGQGIDSFGATSNGEDTTGYGGPDTYFILPVGPGAALFLGQARFIAPLDPGGVTWFSVAAPPTEIDNGVPEPAAWALTLAGLAVAGSALRGRRRRAGAI